MKNKLKFLTYMSLKKKMINKWFVVANVVLFGMIMVVSNIDTIIKTFGGDFDETTQIIVIDETDKAYENLEMNFKTISSYLEEFKKAEIKEYTKSYKEALKEVKEEKMILIRISNDKDKYIKASVTSNKKIDELLYQSITSSINSTKAFIALEDSNITLEQLNKIYEQIEIEKIYLDKEENEESNEMLMGAIFPLIILPFFMLSIYLVQMIGAEINDEKTTRSMEIIIGNVSPRTHFFSKIIAGNIFVLSQSILLLLYGLIGMLVRTLSGASGIVDALGDDAKSVLDTLAESGFLDKLWIIVPLSLVLMALSFLAYSLLAGILASMTTSIEDFQQLQMPIIMISLAGYYLSIASTMFSGSLFIQVMSYVPFISALLTPALLILGEITIFDALISVALLIGLNHLFLKYGLRIYKIGILNYSSSKLWTRMFKAIKDKDAM